MSKLLKTVIRAAIATPLIFTASVYNSNAMAQTPTTPSEQGCLRGYPDGTFRGDRPVTRYEFAAGLNACLDQVNQLLPNRDMATRAEFEALIQRQRELNAEIRELNGRVDNPPATND